MANGEEANALEKRGNRKEGAKDKSEECKAGCRIVRVYNANYF